MSKTAIYVPNRYAGEDLNLPRALRKRTKGSELFWFSVMGKQRVFSADPGNHANIYTPLTESFSRAVIVGDFPALYDTPFTHAWLFSLLHGMGSEGEIWVQIKAEKTNLLNGLVTEQTLRHHFAELEVKRMTRWGSHWVRISCRESELPSVCFPSIYSFLHGQFNQFQNVYRQAKFRDTQVPETIEEEAWGTYLYSLFGANQKTYLL